MPGAICRRTGSAMRWNSFHPLFMRQGSVQPFSVTTADTACRSAAQAEVAYPTCSESVLPVLQRARLCSRRRRQVGQRRLRAGMFFDESWVAPQRFLLSINVRLQRRRRLACRRPGSTGRVIFRSSPSADWFRITRNRARLRCRRSLRQSAGARRPAARRY